MFVIETENPQRYGGQKHLALVSNATDCDTGVMIWMGFFPEAKALPLTKGTVIKKWILWERPDHTRTDLTVSKVNRKTIKVVAEDDGKEYTIRIDR